MIKAVVFLGNRTAVLLSVAMLLVGGNVLAGEEVTVGGELHIRNGTTPNQGTETLKLDELWRAGGDDEETVFGVITQVLSDKDGNIYLLDTQLCEVQVYAPNGEQLRTLSREGEGPGEIRAPIDMLFMPDGNLGLVQSMPGKIVKIDLEGVPASSFTPGADDPNQGGLIILLDANCNAGNLVLGGIHIAQVEGGQERVNFVAAYGEDGKEKSRYLEKSDKLDFNNLKIIEKDQYFAHFRHWDIGPDGRVYAAPHRNRYVIDVYKQDGSLDRVIEREYKSWKRTEKESKRISAAMERAVSQAPFEIKTSIEDTEPDIASLFVSTDGSLWVLSSRGVREQPDGIMLTYDVFDPSGHFVKQVAVACAGDGQEDGLIFTGEDRIVLVKGFIEALLSLQGARSADVDEEEEAAPMEVVYYAIRK